MFLAALPILIKIGKYLLYLVPVIILAVLLGLLYHAGYTKGEVNIQNQWNKDKLAYTQQIALLQKQYDKKEQIHQKESEAINEKLASAQSDHEKAIAAINSDFTGRLLESEQRAAVYKRQANSGTTGCERLASHASQLDRSLEQGRELVQELSATLRQRDDQIGQLSQQILADRKLFSDGNG